MERRVFVPVVPPKELNPNARVHYMTRATWTARYRALTYLYCQEEKEAHGWGTWNRAVLSLEFRYKTERRRDYGNAFAAAKALIDGIVDAGLVPDDDTKHLGIGKIRMVTGVRDDGVLIVLEVADEVDVDRAGVHGVVSGRAGAEVGPEPAVP